MKSKTFHSKTVYSVTRVYRNTAHLQRTDCSYNVFYSIVSCISSYVSFAGVVLRWYVHSDHDGSNFLPRPLNDAVQFHILGIVHKAKPFFGFRLGPQKVWVDVSAYRAGAIRLSSFHCNVLTIGQGCSVLWVLYNYILKSTCWSWYFTNSVVKKQINLWWKYAIKII